MSTERPIFNRKLTPREEMWKFFNSGHTPHSLKPSEDFFKLIEPNSMVLDLGCGWGEKSEDLANRYGAYVTGADINENEIEYAKSIQKNRNNKFIWGDATNLWLPEGNYNHVFEAGLCGGIGPVEREKVIKEAVRLLRPGGLFAMIEFKMNLDDPEQVKKCKEDEEEAGEKWAKVIRKDGKPLFIVRYFIEEELVKYLSDIKLVDIQTREYTVETPGIGDGQMKARKQLTVWGRKPAF